MTKLTIKQELGAIDKRNLNWYNSLTADEHKTFMKTMWVFQRWVSSVSSNIPEIEHHYLTMVNEFVNVKFNDLAAHPELQYRLLMLIGVGSVQSHRWIAPIKKLKVSKGINAKLFDLYLMLHPELSDAEINMSLTFASKDEIVELLEEHGLSSKQIKEYIR